MKTKCASSHRAVAWTAIDWDKCERHVRKLQARIVKAQKEGRYGKVKALQHLLVTSFQAKALAVRRVTSNKGTQKSVTLLDKGLQKSLNRFNLVRIKLCIA